MVLTALAAAVMAASAAPTPAQDPLSFGNTVSCAAMFFVQSQQLTEPEEIEAFEMGMVQMITRAGAMRTDLTEVQIIERAAAEADAILARMERATDAESKAAVIINHGPGMVACIDAVLA
jgi:hypothetical protein